MTYLLRRRKLGKTSCAAIAAKSQQGITVYRNDAPALPEADLVIRWGCTSNVPCDSILNKAEAIHTVSDKRNFRAKLDHAELCPKTWFTLGEVEFPAVVRPAYHHQGRNLWVVNNQAELRQRTAPLDQWYAAALINKVAEYRVFVVQGRVACVARKYPADANTIAWNVAQGGRFENVRWDDWPLKAVRVSLEAFALSGLDFGGVDIMEDAAGEVYVLEINAAPSLTSDYRQLCFAKCFDHIVANGKAPIPLVAARGGYRKFVHPAVCTEAILA